MQIFMNIKSNILFCKCANKDKSLFLPTVLSS